MGGTGGGGPVCGDGIINGNDQCDGDNLGGESCASLGEGTGTLGCDPVTCTFDVSMCMHETPTGGTGGWPGSICGDGIIGGHEQCDGLNLGGETCASLDEGTGTLRCDPVTCTFNVDLCSGSL